MATFVFRCPKTGLNVQGWSAEEIPDDEPDSYDIDPSIVLGPATKRRGGDLARMLGIAQDVVEWTEPLQLSINPDRASQGASVLVLGDSFTLNFAPFFLANGARFEGLAHERCGFDWKIIEENRPKEVWWMPTERFMLCAK